MITKLDLQIVWLMFKDWLKRVFGSRPHFTLCPEPQQEWVR